MGSFFFFDRWLQNLGRPLVRLIYYSLRILEMTYLSFRTTLFYQTQGFRTLVSVISAQVYFTGWQAMPIISVLGLATGAIVILQSSIQLSIFGSASMLGDILVVILIREVGPLITALIVIARSGTAVSSELGNMRANFEIEALKSLGINPMSYIVFPRVVGGVVSVLCLAFYFSAIALVGGFAVSQLINDMPLSFYIDSLADAISRYDVLVFLLKNGFSGLIIFVVSCYQGVSVQQSLHEVPQATTRAVMHSITYVICFNLVLTALFYLEKLRASGWL